MEYKGSCHCGQVKFAAEGELTEALSEILGQQGQQVKKRQMLFSIQI